MKLLDTLAVGMVAAPLLTVIAVTLVAAACLSNASACNSDAIATGATDEPYRPDAAPITSSELYAIGRTVGAPVPAYSVLRDPDAYGTGWGGPSVNMPPQ